MNSLEQEASFFKDISQGVINYVKNHSKNPSIKVSKKEGDYATEVDIAVEEFIVHAIKERFSTDTIMAEEGYSDTSIPKGRAWIIDPICGTTNLRRGLTNFCTNIALANDGQLIASCVVDHAHGVYYWSTGEGKIYVNDSPLTIEKKEPGLGKVIDINFGAVNNLDEQEKEVYSRFVASMITEEIWLISSLNTSLAFTYAAVGKIDGFMSTYDKPWDIAAAGFLFTQSGGVLTQANGSPWTLQPRIASIGSLDPEVHDTLRKLCIKAGY